MKKFLALLLAIAMTLAVCGALAEGPSGDTGDAGAAGSDYVPYYTGSQDPYWGLDSDDHTKIPMTKSIVFFNTNSDQIYEPNISFTYTVAPAGVTDGDASITDANENIAGVYNGIADGVSFVDNDNTITFSSTNDLADADENGSPCQKSTSLTVDITKFEKPGVYRYVITETASDPTPVTGAGLDARTGDYVNTRYLDLYIHYNSDGTALEPYGAVIFKTTTTSTTPGTDDITTTTDKTTGFEPGKPGTVSKDYSDDHTVDRYHTYNVKVTKLITGTMGDTAHEFPFYVTVSNSINGAAFTYTADDAETFTGATNASGKVTLTAANFSIGADDKETSTLKLKNNDTITLTGLPSSQAAALQVVVKEFNDSPDAYTATVANATMGANTFSTPLTGSAAITALDLYVDDGANSDSDITFTNELNDISITGVVVRYTPYLLILAAGLVLLLVSRRKAFRA